MADSWFSEVTLQQQLTQANLQIGMLRSVIESVYQAALDGDLEVILELVGDE